MDEETRTQTGSSPTRQHTAAVVLSRLCLKQGVFACRPNIGCCDCILDFLSHFKGQIKVNFMVGEKTHTHTHVHILIHTGTST